MSLHNLVKNESSNLSSILRKNRKKWLQFSQITKIHLTVIKMIIISMSHDHNIGSKCQLLACTQAQNRVCAICQLHLSKPFDACCVKCPPNAASVINVVHLLLRHTLLDGSSDLVWLDQCCLAVTDSAVWMQVLFVSEIWQNKYSPDTSGMTGRAAETEAYLDSKFCWFWPQDQ